MIVSLDEAKLYLRVDDHTDDNLIEQLIASAENLVQDVARMEDADLSLENETVRMAVYYTIAYLYEHREEADYKELSLTLRALLFGVREAKF